MRLERERSWQSLTFSSSMAELLAGGKYANCAASN
jgi:uncharacterized protein YjaG (DUF416 family)